MDNMGSKTERDEGQFLAKSITSGVETQLLPEEKFAESGRGEVIGMAKIGEVLTTVVKVDDGYEAVSYDQYGKPTKINLSPTTHTIAKKVAGWINCSPGGRSNSSQVKTILKDCGYSEKDAKQYELDWFEMKNRLAGQNISANQDGAIYSNWLVDNNKPPLKITGDPWKVRVVSRSGKDVFVYTTGSTSILLEPWLIDKGNFIPEEEASKIFPKSHDIGPNLRLDHGVGMITIRDVNGNEKRTFTGSDATIDPSEGSNLWFINAGKVYSVDVQGAAQRTAVPIAQEQIEVHDPQEIEFDPHGNFILVRDSKNVLTIFDKKTGEKVSHFENVHGPVLVDAQGDIFFVNKNKKIQEIQTNFQAIPAGGAGQFAKQREAELRERQERFEKLKLPEVQRGEGKITEERVAETLRSSIAQQVSEQITDASDANSVEVVLDKLQLIRNDPDYAGFEGVVDEFIEQAKGKLSDIQVEALSGQISDYEKQLSGIESVGDTVGLDTQFAKILELRQKTDIADIAKRREVDAMLQSLHTKRDEILTKYQGELLQTLEQLVPEIENLVKEAGSSEELRNFGSGVEGQRFELMLAAIRDPDLRREWRRRYRDILQERFGKLLETANKFQQEQNLRWAEVVTESREDLGIIEEQILDVGDLSGLNRLDRNALITSWRAKILALPVELRENEEKRLENLINSRKQELERRVELGAIGERGELKFKEIDFPIYKEPPRLWSPKIVPFKGGFEDLGKLVFVDMQGREFDPSPEDSIVVSTNLEDEKTKRKIEESKASANEYFTSIKRKVPDFDEHWVIGEYHEERLAELAEILKLQLLHHRGIAIMSGEAGAGKNVLCDMLANLSNREVITVPCNRNTTREDLTYEFYFDPDEGTYKVPSRLIEAIQTPGTIVLFDEINALPAGVAKMLNSLFDYRRRLFITEGGHTKEIVVDPTVMFVGTMNPQHYQGVSPLSSEVKSRSRIIDIEYPPFVEQRSGVDYYRDDEALILSRYMDSLRQLSPKDFKLVWNNVVNREQDNGADVILESNPNYDSDVRRVYDVLRVADQLRRTYRAYQIAESNEPMDFPTSMRELIDIVMEMNHKEGINRIIKRVILPKIDDLAQRRTVDTTIDAVLPQTN